MPLGAVSPAWYSRNLSVSPVAIRTGYVSHGLEKSGRVSERKSSSVCAIASWISEVGSLSSSRFTYDAFVCSVMSSRWRAFAMARMSSKSDASVSKQPPPPQNRPASMQSWMGSLHGFSSLPFPFLAPEASYVKLSCGP
jgi:hypothetical protein